MRRLISYFSRKQNQAVDGVDVIRQHFDAQFYVSAYPDVADSSIDLAEHYFVVGWRHGRDPCAWFSTEEYLKANGDVAEADVNPFYHYLTHGREEGRVVVASRLSDSRRGAASHSAGTESSRRPPEGAPGMSEDVLAQQRSVVAGAFDTNFYRSTYPDLHPLNDDQLVDHFNEHGWRERRDPCPWFSTNYYLKRYPDIGRGGINPLYHYLTYGQREGRLPDYYHRHKRGSAARPRVSAIIPNFNHARFLEERIQSIVAQEWLPEEIIILDDASTDDSREVIERIAKTIDIPLKIVLNDENSGNVFRQWEKGVSMASAEVLWICESDDFCDRKFLSTLAPYFCDPSIMIAFGAIQFASADGAPLAGLDEYRESAARGFWNEPRVESAPEWFKGPFGLRNVIANVGGCLIRRQTIEKSIWTEAQSYRVCGDWFLYMHLAHGGRIAFDPRAIAFFRQHAKNTSVSSFRSLSFYEEHFRIALELQRMYGVSDANICRFYRIVRTQFLKALGDEPGSNLDAVFSLNTLINQERVCPHILIMILGFLTGGGEIFPINLANALAERGYAVSVMPLMTAGENEEIRGRLDSRIAIYERNLIDEIGFDRFLESQQIDLVHTHYIAADIDYHKAIRARRLPYVVTHHGSYEVTEVDSATLMSIMSAVQHWVYISDKNLEKLEALGLNRAATTKLPNAVPLRHATFPYTRQSLGIEESAFVFGVASRAILPKGWDIAAKALEKVRAENHRPVYVVFCGEGPDYEELYNAHNEKEGIIFLGYQREIMAFYEMCDCALLPTRFQGESYPLTIIEAIIKNIPVIATDIGELKHMIKPDDIAAGVLVPNIEDDDVFIAEVAAAMNKMLNVHEHARYVRGARKIAELYDFDHLVTQYEKVYKVAGLKGVPTNDIKANDTRGRE
ncbi:glycosyltransferase [Methylocystis sp. WRRC1]|uniref:glycosyltransferase n=1 Tax=Methylocystis sp. WRRC1 TaxID=1732014 RepID=UPI001D14C7F6|nr:glycosyltransferase [Methylocystis sp. WRRC1]MCC3245472.1 glycosyltransferase [Methylocystis sp. WRRC1]